MFCDNPLVKCENEDIVKLAQSRTESHRQLPRSTNSVQMQL